MRYYLLMAAVLIGVTLSAATNSVEITAKTTTYNRKEGVALFDGAVRVSDGTYQLCADKAYVFMAETNALKRIVAIGSVAMTNENRRAYGVKASYHHDTGMVILYGDEEHPAEIREELQPEARVVKGSKIRFWVNDEQVEVLDARITAPSGGKSTIGLGKELLQRDKQK